MDSPPVNANAQNHGRRHRMERHVWFVASRAGALYCFAPMLTRCRSFGGGLSLTGSSCLLEPAHLAGHLLYLPARQALVHQHDRQAELLFQTHRKAFHLIRHFASRAIKAQRMPDNDPPRALLARDLAQTLHVVAAILALERFERTCHNAHFVRNSKPNPFSPVINRQNSLC